MEFIEGGFEVADAGVEFVVGDVEAGVGFLDFAAGVLRRAAGGEGEEFGDVDLQEFFVGVAGFPFHGLIVMNAQAALDDAVAGEIDAGIGEHAGDPVVGDVGDSLLAAEAVIEGFFRGGEGGGIAGALALELLGLSHALGGAFVGFLVAGGVEVLVLGFGGSAAGE